MNNQNHTQPAHPALQAHSRPVPVAQRNTGGLTDGLTGSLCLLSAFSGAINGMSRLLLLVQSSAIHNHRLSMLSSKKQAVARSFLSHHDSLGSTTVVMHTSEKVHIRALFTYSARTRTSVPGCSGTLRESRQRGVLLHPGEWRESPVGFSLDRVGYTPNQRRQGGQTSVLSIPSCRLGPFRTPCPVKADSRNVSSRTHPGGFPASPHTQADRGPVSGAEQVTRTALVAWASLPDCEVLP